MKISAKHLFRFLIKVSLEELSKRLMQLGHENEVDGDIIDLEITPNREIVSRFLEFHENLEFL